jgi:hypothetical protein
MRRRKLLAGLGAVVATAGCVSGYRGDRRSTGDGGPEESDIETLTLAEQGNPPTICEEELKPEGIRAIDDPSFGTPAEWPDDPEGYRSLTDDMTVIGLTNDGAARAYPLTILNVHEVVNDTFDRPVVVTYCPICRSGMVADRHVDGEVAVFDVSGLLWVPPRIYTAAAEAEGRVFSDREEGVGNNGNLVMYDELTDSLWSQILGKAVQGPKTGEALTLRPSTMTSWKNSASVSSCCSRRA